jgi:hypothetical protein
MYHKAIAVRKSYIISWQGNKYWCGGQGSLPRGLLTSTAAYSQPEDMAAMLEAEILDCESHVGIICGKEVLDEVFTLSAGVSPGMVVDLSHLHVAKQLPDWSLWKEAIKKEFDQLDRIEVWEVVELLKGAHIIGSKFVLYYKMNPAGEIASRKARLIALDNNQKKDIDYQETFTLTAKLTAIRIICMLAAQMDWELKQVDVDGECTSQGNDLYVFAGFEDANVVRKLLKALYGLWQGGREWYEHLRSIMLELGFIRCQVEIVVFFRYQVKSALIISVNVDNMMVAGNTKNTISKFKTELTMKVKIKDLDELHWLLGIEVIKNHATHEIAFSQCAYIVKVLKHFDFTW